MLIKIKKDIFESDNLSDLNYLIRILSYKGRYDFYADYNVIVNLQTFTKLDDFDKLNIEGQFNKFTTESSKPDLIISDNIDENNFSLDEAIPFLQQPVIVVLEHSSNDGHFIKAIVKHFDKKGKLIQHLKNNWLKLGNAGGKNNFINYLTGELKTFRSLPKPNHKYLRAFVVTDSDKKSPTSTLSHQYLVDFLAENNIQYHILEKREIENYLPDEVIDSIPDNREFIDAYLDLNPIQKDYFDLEKGFPNKNFNDLEEVIKRLYSDVDEANKKIFRKNALSDKYRTEGKSFKKEFPKLFQHSTVTKETLLKRCKHHTNEPLKSPYNPKELPDLVEKIAKLL